MEISKFRTQQDATENVVTVSQGTTGNASYLISEDRYIAGGELIVENAHLGDTIELHIKDVDSLIPEVARAAFPEWPILATYVEKKWMKPSPTSVDNPGNYSYYQLNTRPTIAKLTVGFHIFLVYHAINSGGDRRIALNLDLINKL